MKTTLHFGIEINFEINNKFYLDNRYEIYKSHWIKNDTFHFIQKISDSYEEIEHEINCYKRDAELIRSFDSDKTITGRTQFYLVVFATQNDEVVSVKRIRDIY